MKPILMTAAAVAALGFASSSLAQTTAPSTYVEGDVGAVLKGRLHANGNDVLLGPVALKESLRRGWMASGLVGRRLGDGPVSVEAEGLYLNDAIKSDDLNAVLGTSAGLRVQSYGAVANVKLEKPLPQTGGAVLAPYVAAGAGYGHASVSILGDHYTGDGLLWQAKAGVALQWTPRLTWTVGYRYVHLPTFDTNKLGLAARLKTNAQVVSVGLRYSFSPAF